MGIWLQSQRLFMLQRKKSNLLKPVQGWQWKAMKTMTTYKHSMWNHPLYSCFVLNAFKWDKMSVWRWIKACENRREAKTLKSIRKVSLSIWHLEKRCHGEVSQDILWRLTKSAEVNRFDMCVHEVQNVGLECNKNWTFKKIPPHINILTKPTCH